MSNLSYTSGTSTIPLLGITIGDKFDKIVAQYPKQEALVVIHQNIRWTYLELQVEVDRCAKALIACGLQKGDRVGIWSPNRYEW
ncbi:MAG: AMP-binding protein, partial [Saprospiraceae bacterium]